MCSFWTVIYFKYDGSDNFIFPLKSPGTGLLRVPNAHTTFRNLIDLSTPPAFMDSVNLKHPFKNANAPATAVFISALKQHILPGRSWDWNNSMRSELCLLHRTTSNISLWTRSAILNIVFPNADRHQSQPVSLKLQQDWKVVIFSLEWKSSKNGLHLNWMLK